MTAGRFVIPTVVMVAVLFTALLATNVAQPAEADSPVTIVIVGDDARDSAPDVGPTGTERNQRRAEWAAVTR